LPGTLEKVPDPFSPFPPPRNRVLAEYSACPHSRCISCVSQEVQVPLKGVHPPMISGTGSMNDGLVMEWILVLAIAACGVVLGCQPKPPNDREEWVVFEVKGGPQLSLTAYGREFAKTGQRVRLAKVLPGARLIAVRQEKEGTTTFLINTNEPIVFWQDGREVDVSLIDERHDAKTRTVTETIVVRGPRSRPAGPETKPVLQ